MTMDSLGPWPDTEKVTFCKYSGGEGEEGRRKWSVVAMILHSKHKKHDKIIFFTDQDMIEAIPQIWAKTKRTTKKNHKINFEVHELRIILHLLNLIQMFRKHPQFDGQVCHNLRFLEFFKKRKKANFKSKNLCDKSSKIKKSEMTHFLHFPLALSWYTPFFL